VGRFETAATAISGSAAIVSDHSVHILSTRSSDQRMARAEASMS
jgi:hypothetical protein